jgi:hypothetical protein
LCESIACHYRLINNQIKRCDKSTRIRGTKFPSVDETLITKENTYVAYFLLTVVLVKISLFWLEGWSKTGFWVFCAVSATNS